MLISNDGNRYVVTEKKEFDPQIIIDLNILEKCLDFANHMTFRETGEHRSYRSGGEKRRKKAEIFADVFQGKVAEMGFYELYKKHSEISEPDFSISGLGEWDKADFIVNDNAIAVKSTKKYGNLLLLETKDWSENGEYIPNKEKELSIYSYIYLVRVSNSLSDIMKSKRFLYSEQVDIKIIAELIKNKEWSVEITGYITHKDFVNKVIKKNKIIPKDALLNNRIKMDAENYYVEAGCLNPFTP